jgi:Ca2+/Na+ antiporter
MLMAITFSLVIIIPYFMVYGISINSKKFKDLPMPKRHAKSAPVVVAYSLVATIAFLFFTKLGFHYFWLFILFLSPYLIFLIIKVAKASRSWVLGKMIRKTE